jgi:hypothetical protein
VRRQDIAVNQVVRRVADEGIAAIRLGKEIGGIDNRAARGGDEAARHKFGGWEALGVGTCCAAGGAFDTPGLERADAINLASGIVVGNVKRDSTDRQQ